MDDKRTQILEAALKRFKRFGVSKTTMEEIAKDLDISKSALYYYFSDKDSIYVAVVERMVDGCFESLMAHLEQQPAITDTLDKYLSLKRKMLLEYHFLFGINEWIKETPSSLMRQIGELLHRSETRFLSAWIRQGIASGQLAGYDPERTAELLVNVMFGLWIVWCKQQATDFDPYDTTQLELFMDREKEVLSLFFNGLTHQPALSGQAHHIK